MTHYKNSDLFDKLNVFNSNLQIINKAVSLFFETAPFNQIQNKTLYINK